MLSGMHSGTAYPVAQPLPEVEGEAHGVRLLQAQLGVPEVGVLQGAGGG